MSQNFALTNDQRLLLQLYIDFYNHTNRQMNTLYELQNEIIGNINQIVGLNRMRQPRNSMENPNNSRTNFRQNNQNTRDMQEQRRRRNNLETTNRRYMYYGNIPYVVPVERSAREIPIYARENNRDANFFTNFLRFFNDRVHVAPTRQQIEAATRIVSFSEIENPLNTTCPVTLDRFENNSNVTQIIPCGHIFSPSGIESWLQSNVQCPVCRYDIRDYNINTPHTNISSEESTPNNEETKEEGPLEESKIDSEETNQERNSIPNQNNNINRTTITGSDIQNTITSLTENILAQILNPHSNSTGNSHMRNFVFDNSFNSFTYDASNNSFSFEGSFR